MIYEVVNYQNNEPVVSLALTRGPFLPCFPWVLRLRCVCRLFQLYLITRAHQTQRTSTTLHLFPSCTTYGLTCCTHCQSVYFQVIFLKQMKESSGMMRMGLRLQTIIHLEECCVHRDLLHHNLLDQAVPLDRQIVL